MLIQSVSEEPDGVDLFFPAAYDLLWSVVALAALAGVGALVVLAVRALKREPAPALPELADGDPERSAAQELVLVLAQNGVDYERTALRRFDQTRDPGELANLVDLVAIEDA
ncbi:hypothetical protein [Cellulosimicrobium funkei]